MNESNLLNIKKVKNIKDDFILGMDVSSIISLKESNVKYYDFDGTQKDLFEILKDNGINYIRIRVWNDPFDENGHGYGGGNNDINRAIIIATYAKKYNLKVLINFHYSDFWADPKKQMAPKAWKNMDIISKSIALYNYTKECLLKLKEKQIDVGIVQIGNETNGAMCGETNWKNIQLLFKAGSKAVKEVYNDALVAIHFANPEIVNNYYEYADKLDKYNVDYDVFASSYYPFWHGTLKNLTTLLSFIAKKYNKKIIIAENSYAYTLKDFDFCENTISKGKVFDKYYPFSIKGQARQIRDVINAIVNKIDNGIGYFYWEGAWIGVNQPTLKQNQYLWEKYGSGWASSYASSYDPDDAGKYYGGCAVENQALFNNNGKALESLKVFKLIK